MEYEKVTEILLDVLIVFTLLNRVPYEKFNRAAATCSENADSQFGNPTFPYEDHSQNHLGQND